MMAAKDDYQDFKVALNDLKLNSKPLINFLTILAEEKLHNAPQIVRAIEERIIESKNDHILPALYVLDSIVKNLRSSVYVQLFETKLPVLFANAFNKVDERTRSAMFKLRQTWSPFFTNLSLYNLDTRTHDIDPAWPITARVPDPPPFAQNIHLNPNFLQRNPSSSGISLDQEPPITDEVRQQILRLQQEDSDSSVFRTRTVNQPPVSISPPKISELTTRGDSYHMIPIERMEQIRQETAHVLDLGVDGEQQSKIKKNLTGKKKKINKKRRPSARLRRRAVALAQAVTNNDQDTSEEDDHTSEEGNNDNNDDDIDDEPFIIKPSLSINNAFRIQSTDNVDQSTSGGTVNDVEVLFGGIDKDYRDTNGTTSQTTNSSNLDADSIFEINSKCLLLAEQKYKSKELSSEEYQATLKLLQNILESEVKRLTVQQTTTSSLLNGTNHHSLITQTNSHPPAPTPIPSHPFQQQLLQFAQQHASQTNSTSQQSSLSTFSNPSFSFPGFGNDAYRHVMQILATVGAPPSYTSNYNFLPYLPPLPPAPPSFTLVQNTFQSQQSSDQQLYPHRQSPPLKRPHDENNNNNLYPDEDHKRPRYDPVTGRETRPRNFDEENVAPVPSLIDANINMLKKKYVGIVQQLYIGKFQCRLCGLRFTAKQKHYYTHHLDWHYLENKQEKDLGTTTSSALLQRTQHWYSSVQEWTIYEENIEEEIRTGKFLSTQIRPIKENNQLFMQGENILSSSGIISCPATGNGEGDDDRCYVCHDPFENFFDDNREEWHLKDAIRVDGKTYHPICYQDVQYEATNEKAPVIDLPYVDSSSVSLKLTTDGINNLSSDPTTIDLAVTIKTDNDDPVIEPSSITDELTEPNYLSSPSFVDLVETIFMKKEDIKPIENSEQLIDTPIISEDIPLSSIQPEPLINNTSEELETILN